MITITKTQNKAQKIITKTKLICQSIKFTQFLNIIFNFAPGVQNIQNDYIAFFFRPIRGQVRIEFPYILFEENPLLFIKYEL